MWGDESRRFVGNRTPLWLPPQNQKWVGGCGLQRMAKMLGLEGAGMAHDTWNIRAHRRHYDTQPRLLRRRTQHDKRTR